jgi:hypothetical protein
MSIQNNYTQFVRGFVHFTCYFLNTILFTSCLKKSATEQNNPYVAGDYDFGEKGPDEKNNFVAKTTEGDGGCHATLISQKYAIIPSSGCDSDSLYFFSHDNDSVRRIKIKARVALKKWTSNMYEYINGGSERKVLIILELEHPYNTVLPSLGSLSSGPVSRQILAYRKSDKRYNSGLAFTLRSKRIGLYCGRVLLGNSDLNSPKSGLSGAPVLEIINGKSVLVGFMLSAINKKESYYLDFQGLKVLDSLKHFVAHTGSPDANQDISNASQAYLKAIKTLGIDASMPFDSEKYKQIRKDNLLKYHPDKAGNSPEAIAKAQEIIAAIEWLDKYFANIKN